MRLLDITDFPIVTFREVVDPGLESYVILSHVWDKAANVEGCEPTFQELSSIISAINPALPDGPRYKKLKGFCEVAFNQGYTLAWADMCCIDKTSSAELSEAIASMFYWYQCAEVCYVYLKDVSSPQHEDSEPRSLPFKLHNSDEFRRSVWFTRGWTLQELIAPKSVVFCSKDWTILGSKCGELADIICDITRVNKEVLTHQQPLESVSVAQRMLWAANRRTSRLEDRAYSLMGLFGVGIPVLYGEREYAFIRLQEEILRRIPDSTLLAWGSLTSWSTLGLRNVTTGVLGAFWPLRRWVGEVHVRVREPSWARADHHTGYLFALSPDDFQTIVRPIGPGSKQNGAFSRTRTDICGPRAMNIIPPNMLVMDTNLIQAIVPPFYAGNMPNVSESTTNQKYYLIPLGCETVKSEPIALLLCPPTDPDSPTDHTATLDDPYWVIGADVREAKGSQTTYRRIVTLPPSDNAAFLKSQPATLKTPTGSVHLPLSAPRSALTTCDDVGDAFSAKCGFFDVRLGGWCQAALTARGFNIEKEGPTETDMVYLFTLIPPAAPHAISSGRDRKALERIIIAVGNCPPAESDPNHPPEDCHCIFTGSVNLNIPNSSSTESTSCRCSCGEIGNHIVSDPAHPGPGTLWSFHGGIAIRSTSFFAYEVNDVDKLETRFKLAIRLRRASLSPRRRDTKDFLLEIEFHPDPVDAKPIDEQSRDSDAVVSRPS